jgi:hypothetical protein
MVGIFGDAVAYDCCRVDICFPHLIFSKTVFVGNLKGYGVFACLNAIIREKRDNSPRSDILHPDITRTVSRPMQTRRTARP